MIKKLFDKLILSIKNDKEKITTLLIFAKYICPIVALLCLILIFSLKYENSYNFSDLKKVEGNFNSFKEERVSSLWDIVGKGWKVFKLKIFLENSSIYYSMLDNPTWYSFLYGLKEGDKLEIYYLPQYDNRIKELVVNGVKKYTFEQEKGIVSGKIKDNFNLVLFTLIVHFFWRYNYPKFLWPKYEVE